jgi:L-seryl-tRNA(Ser) seleniumtransferase
MLALEARFGSSAIVDALRAEAAAVRHEAAGADDVIGVIERGATARLERHLAPSLRRVINATGVILHTNLGRAPLGPVAVERLARVAAGYTNLEYDLDRGERGRRDVHAERVLCRLTGAEAAVVVNNNAAATLLVLAALARGREVIISRGELVEIGGGFRVPDVLAQSGCILREVGTTNRTRVADYAAAINERTAMILRVHPSNFRMEGFTERATVSELADLGHRFKIPLAEDIGSGFLGLEHTSADANSGASRVLAGALRDEPIVSASIGAGADVVMFSGDKLLGGPQGGIIAGRETLVAEVRRHPLMRALRVDKLTYAALEATLEEFAAGRAEVNVPVAAMLMVPLDEIERRARVIAEALSERGITATVIDGESAIGGGSAPGATVPTKLVAIEHPSQSPGESARRLRQQTVPLIARIEQDRLIFDLRTVDPEDDQTVIDAAVASFGA